MTNPYAPRKLGHEYDILYAAINWDSDDWYGFMLGYRTAAQQLVEQASTTGYLTDVLVYPILFLYRHSVEVGMKGLILKLSCLLEKKSEEVVIHDLERIWDICLPLVREVSTPGDQDFLKRTTLLIKKVNSIDKHSMAFRYPVDKNRKKFLQGLGHLIDIRIVQEVWDELTMNLEAMHCQVDYFISLSYD